MKRILKKFLRKLLSEELDLQKEMWNNFVFQRHNQDELEREVKMLRDCVMRYESNVNDILAIKDAFHLSVDVDYGGRGRFEATALLAVKTKDGKINYVNNINLGRSQDVVELKKEIDRLVKRFNDDNVYIDIPRGLKW